MEIVSLAYKRVFVRELELVEVCWNFKVVLDH
jgi:hypothetical protein